MEVAFWGTVVATAGLVITLGTIVWRLASRLAASEAKSEAAEKSLAATTVRLDTLTQHLSEHKEQSAREYVSYGRMADLEGKLVGAINNLGDRIDRLFSAKVG